MVTASPVPRTARPPLRRVRQGRMLAGVARGLAEHLRIRVLFVRIALLVLASPLFNGLGALFYVAMWIFAPSSDGAGGATRKERAQWPALLAIGLGALMFFAMSGWADGTMIIGWLAAVIALGAGLIWHQVRPDAPWLDSLVGTAWRRPVVVRIVGGCLLVVVGVIGTMAIIVPLNDENLSSVLNGMLFAAIALAGIGLVCGPLIWRTLTNLRAERVARVREQERADIAAMVHDQVLHTLALIQRQAGDAREVHRLARGQERSLRNWLYRPTADGVDRFSDAVEAAAAEVEDSFAVDVEVAVVGDADMDEHVAALVAAAREAMVNAAKHAGVPTISVFAEAEPQTLSVFVRDRGAGFDPDGVADDRHGVRGSIVGRMERHHGSAQVLSTLGEGTEVRLTMPRTED